MKAISKKIRAIQVLFRQLGTERLLFVASEKTKSEEFTYYEQYHR